MSNSPQICKEVIHLELNLVLTMFQVHRANKQSVKNKTKQNKISHDPRRVNEDIQTNYERICQNVTDAMKKTKPGIGERVVGGVTFPECSGKTRE